MNTSEPTLGIDFGTSTSSMAWFNPATQRAEIIKNAEGKEQTPSVVYFGEGEPVVGDAALVMLEDPKECGRVILSAKRELANDGILPVLGRRLKALDVAVAILRKLKTDADQLHFHETVKRAVITCPATFNSLERERVRKAGMLAGFEEVTLIEEPVAAAVAYAREGLQVGKYILVYDLGGGTFDLAVLAQEDGAFRLAFEPRGIRRCGGDDFDWALYDHCEALAQERLGRSFGQTGVDQSVLWACRRVKESLTGLAHSTLSVYLEGVPFKEVIERATFEALIRERIETTVRLTREILEEARQRGQAVDTVVLIGGSSRIPLILRQLREALPLAPQEWQHQDVAVALGAAYYGLSIKEDTDGIRKDDYCLSIKEDTDGIHKDDYGLYFDFASEGITQRFRWLEPGTFLMGSPKTEKERSEDEVQHSVTLTQGFWLADTTVTQALWQAVMGNNPSTFKDDQNNPVENVSWNDTQAFIAKLNQLIPDIHAHLPTETQWEYACRAGTQTPFSFGDNITPELVNYDGNYPYARGDKGQYRAKTVAVKSLPANPWGLYEMHGNVWEWCQVIDPKGPNSGTYRVMRGGSWYDYGRDVRSATRGGHGHTPDDRGGGLGFRLALGFEFRPSRVKNAAVQSGASGVGTGWHVKDEIIRQLCILIGSSPLMDATLEDGILSILRDFLPQEDFFVSPGIPSKKLSNAWASCSVPQGERILGLVDCTIFGSAKDALLFGVKGIYYHHPKVTPNTGSLSYSDFDRYLFRDEDMFEIKLIPKERFMFHPELKFTSSGSSMPRNKLINILKAIRMLSLYKQGREHLGSA